MRILSRYLIKQHAAPFVFSLTALTGFMLLNQIARRLEQLVGKDLPWTIIVEYFVLTIPYLIAMTISMSVLVAVLYTFSHLARDSEITAFRAGGISLGQLVWPVLIAAACVAFFSFLFGDQVLPRTNHRLRVLMSSIGRTKPTFVLKEHAINEVQPRQVFLRAARIDPASFIMRDVTIYRFPRDGSAMGTIYADSGRIAFAPNQEDLQLVLFHGTAHEFDRRQPANFQRTTYHRYIIGLPSVGGVFERGEGDEYHSDREMGTCALEEVVLSQRRQRWLAQRAGEAAQRNGLRALVGLPPIRPDSIAPEQGRSLYCRLLDWVLPQPLEAQDRPRNRAQSDTATTIVRDLADTQRRALFTSSRTPRARMNEIRIQHDRERGHQMRAAAHLVEFHKKYAIPAACLVFVLIGVPLALRFPGGLGMVIAAAMVIFGIYYVGLIAGESLANKLKIPPFWAMWTPNVVFSIIGGTAMWRMARQGINVRGSSWSPLRSFVRRAKT
ncbi:MAG: LptF/LptG family permease [Gemmatimonadota bacterium]|nr:MAG: LptF/LptG family permease [Gemmatimonadota bacterium]